MKKLIRFMKANKISGPTLARKLGVSNATVYLWINGINTPGVVHAIRLDRFSKGHVSVYDWE